MFQRLTLWGIPNFSCVRVFGLLGMIEKKRRKKNVMFVTKSIYRLHR